MTTEKDDCSAGIHLTPLGDTVGCELYKGHASMHRYSFKGYRFMGSKEIDFKQEPNWFFIEWVDESSDKGKTND
jgi:hypothetical protein